MQRLCVLLIGLILTACGGCKGFLINILSPDYEALAAAPSAKRLVDFAKVSSGYEQITDLQFLPTEPAVIMVLEKTGTLRWFHRETKAKGKWRRFKVISASEQGALGMTFHPRYAENGSFYIHRTVRDDGRDMSRIEHWENKPGCAVSECRPRQARVLLEAEQPYSNHNAGQLAFGPDGYLYIGFGDGGWRGDPDQHGQNPATFLGSMLRIDVDREENGKPYGIPKDNPGRTHSGAAPEMYAYGLRNPWRYSFDPQGRLVVADVGQDRFEEVHVVEAGANLGWPLREASHCYEPKNNCSIPGLTDPVFEIPRVEAASITGGYVYLGDELPWLKGQYLVGDFLTGGLWALELPKALPAKASPQKLGVFPYRFSTFARDSAGEIYAAGFANGQILKLTQRKKKR
ncbi:MAG: PQQ-dependent sugar dehydrogenase [Myxococcota bacterium]|nr:PQQ-dependent sugar dehydrogenase [Myxococcota bacterium]